MHRFQLIQINKGSSPHTYALMDGKYFGGNTNNDITCLTPVLPPSDEKRFQLTVSGNVATLSTNNSTIYINGIVQDVPLKDRIIKPGDLIGIGCSTTQESIEDPMGYVFRLMNRVNPKPKFRSPCNCYHPPSPYDTIKSDNRIDCPYPNCPFSCWNIKDLNVHILGSEEHVGDHRKRMEAMGYKFLG